MRVKTASGRLLGALLNIDSALTLTSFPRRDDADDFFAIFISLALDRVGLAGSAAIALPGLGVGSHCHGEDHGHEGRFLSGSRSPAPPPRIRRTPRCTTAGVFQRI